jgi:hypothetical protein
MTAQAWAAHLLGLPRTPALRAAVGCVHEWAARRVGGAGHRGWAVGSGGRGRAGRRGGSGGAGSAVGRRARRGGGGRSRPRADRRRAGRWQLAAVSPEDYIPPARVVTLLTRIAAGDAEPLGGRFLHAEDDLDELLADAALIRDEDLLTLRLRELPEA